LNVARDRRKHEAMSSAASSKPSTQPPVKRLGGVTGRGWEPGRSGNAGGRPRAVVNVQELARTYTEQAVHTLVDALRDPKLKVQAACALLDRGWGKPTQTIAADPATSPIALHLIAAELISAEIIQRQLEPQPQTIQQEQPQLQHLLDAPPPLE
jgi:hypothetical protein